MRRIIWVLALACTLCLVACGGSSPPKPTAKAFTARVPTSELARKCPPNQGRMGCAMTAPPKPNGFLSAPAGPLFPDVSSWQGFVNWNAVAGWQKAHGWPVGGIFKMGEYSVDPYAYRNNTYLSSIHGWRGGYWFIRNTGCTHEEQQIENEATGLGLKLVVLDLETPEAAGYGACLSPVLKAHGFEVVEYTAPGTNPGGVDTSDPLWIATYGSGFGCIWTCRPVAWQFTDGHWGAVTTVPGVGQDDVNVDYGISRLIGPPVDPYHIYSKTVRHFGSIVTSEYNAVKGWDHYRCLNPVRRKICIEIHTDLTKLSGRLWVVVHRHTPPDWSHADRGARFHGMWVRLHHTKH